jgi:hypothetical protein
MRMLPWSAAILRDFQQELNAFYCLNSLLVSDRGRPRGAPP